jgi:potassium channel LctB
MTQALRFSGYSEARLIFGGLRITLGKAKLKKLDLDKKFAKQRERITALEKFLFKPWWKVIYIIAFFGIIAGIVAPRVGLESEVFLGVTISLGITTTIYYTYFLVYLIRRVYNRLLSAQNLFRLLVSYVIFIMLILLLFAVFYRFTEQHGFGYLTYGKCQDRFEKDMASRDTEKSSSYFYFAAVTFFTVGYGDICPMGAAKLIALVNAFIGSFVTVVLMVIVISAFLHRINSQWLGD